MLLIIHALQVAPYDSSLDYAANFNRMLGFEGISRYVLRSSVVANADLQSSTLTITLRVEHFPALGSSWGLSISAALSSSVGLFH